MQHEKIIKREDGTKYNIRVRAWENGTSLVYRFDIRRCLPGKRTWLPFIDTDSHTYRALSMDKRQESEYNQYLQHVTAQEIQEAKEELWQKLKP